MHARHPITILLLEDIVTICDNMTAAQQRLTSVRCHINVWDHGANIFY